MHAINGYGFEWCTLSVAGVFTDNGPIPCGEISVLTFQLAMPVLHARPARVKGLYPGSF